MIHDPHDPRPFRRYVQFAADGTVASTHDVEAGATAPAGFVEVTDLSPMDFSGISIDPVLVDALFVAVQDVSVKTDAISTAETNLSKALTAHDTAVGNARSALSVSAGKTKA